MASADRFHPRRMAYGGANQAAVASDFSSLALFNNSNYAEYLIVRHWTATFGGSVQILAGVVPGSFGGTAVTPIPYFPNEALPPGTLTKIAAVAAQTTGYAIGGSANVNFSWPLDLPFAVVPQGYTFFIQCTSANNAITASVMWEAIKPEQLEPELMLAAIAALQPQ